MVSLPLVPLTMTVSAGPSPPPPGRRQVDVDLGDVGAGQVVDGDGVGAAEGVEVDRLDVVEVHDDVADVAGEPDPLAVGRDVDLLVDVGAVEEHRVGAVLALDRVAAVARIPLEHVVAGAQQGRVVALLAVDEVVAVAAEQHVGAVAAEDRVVAGAAVDGDLDQRGQPLPVAENVSSPPFMLTTRFSLVPMSMLKRGRV